MTRALVVGRRRKGRHIAAAVDEVRAALEAAGWDADSAVVDRRPELRSRTARAVRRGYDIVVAVGGDGAVNEVATTLMGTKVVLGIIPMGTGNLLAGNLGIPAGREDAVRTIVAGVRRRIDAGRATVDGMSYAVAVACGVGFDAEVMDATRSRDKRRWGKLAYVAGVVGARGRIRNEPHRITLDGVTMKTRAAEVMIANFGRMAAGISPRRPVLPDDGLLEVVVVRASGPISALGAAWEALRQSELGDSSSGHVFRAQARKVRVETRRPRLVEIDGNVVGRTPLRVTIHPAALIVMVPPT